VTIRSERTKMKELSQRHRQQVAYHRHGIHLAEAYPGPGKADPDDESEGKDGENDERVERQGAESAEGPVHGLLAVGPSLDAALQDRGEDGVDDDLGEDDRQDPRPLMMEMGRCSGTAGSGKYKAVMARKTRYIMPV